MQFDMRSSAQRTQSSQAGSQQACPPLPLRPCQRANKALHMHSALLNAHGDVFQGMAVRWEVSLQKLSQKRQHAVGERPLHKWEAATAHFQQDVLGSKADTRSVRPAVMTSDPIEARYILACSKGEGGSRCKIGFCHVRCHALTVQTVGCDRHACAKIEHKQLARASGTARHRVRLKNTSFRFML